MKSFFQLFPRGAVLALLLWFPFTAPAQEQPANEEEKKSATAEADQRAAEAAPAAAKENPVGEAPAADTPPAPEEPPPIPSRDAVIRDSERAKSRADQIKRRADEIRRNADEMRARARARADEERARHREMTARRTGDDVVNIFGNSRLSAGHKADNVVSIFGNSTSEGEVVEAVVSVFGNAKATGSVGDVVVAVFGNVEVDSHVGGVVAVFGNVELGPKAEVDQEVVCVMGQVNRDPQAVVHHEVQSIGPSFALGTGLQTWVKECFLKARPLAFDQRLGWAWAIAFALLAFYALLALVFRGGIESCTRTLETRPGASLLTAIATVMLSPIVIVFLCVIVVGIIVVPFLGMGLLIASLFGKAVMLAWIGRRITKLLGDGPLNHPAFGVLVGGVIALALYTLPIFGFLIYKLLGWLGLGVVVLTVLTSLKRERAARAISAPVMVGVVSPAPLPANVVSPGLEGGVAAAVVPPVISAVTLPRAGFWIRLGALAIDVILVYVLTHMLTGIFPVMGPIHIKAELLPSLALYGTLMWKLRGTTIGGIVCGLKVIRLDGREIDWGTAIVRALGCFLSLIVAGLGFIWVAIDGESQSWHDKIAGTTVVHVPKSVSLL